MYNERIEWIVKLISIREWSNSKNFSSKSNIQFAMNGSKPDFVRQQIIRIACMQLAKCMTCSVFVLDVVRCMRSTPSGDINWRVAHVKRWTQTVVAIYYSLPHHSHTLNILRPFIQLVTEHGRLAKLYIFLFAYTWYIWVVHVAIVCTNITCHAILHSGMSSWAMLNAGHSVTSRPTRFTNYNRPKE